MTQQEIIDIIIKAMQENNTLSDFHKIQNGRGVQIRITSGQFFNIGMTEVKEGNSYIAQKLRKY